MQPPNFAITLAMIGTEIPHIQKKNTIPPNELAGPTCIISPHNMYLKKFYDLAFINVIHVGLPVHYNHILCISMLSCYS